MHHHSILTNLKKNLQDKLQDFTGFCSFLQDTPPPPPSGPHVQPATPLANSVCVLVATCRFTSCTPPEAMEKSLPQKLQYMYKWSTPLALLHVMLLPILLTLTSSLSLLSSWRETTNGRTWSFTKESLGKITCTSSINGVRCLSSSNTSSLSNPKLMTSICLHTSCTQFLHTKLFKFQKKAGHLGWLAGRRDTWQKSRRILQKAGRLATMS